MPSEAAEDAKKKLTTEMQRFEKNYHVPDLSVRSDGAGHLRIYHGDKPFVPVLRLKLDVNQLRMLTMSLSEYLAEPLERARQQAVMHGNR